MVRVRQRCAIYPHVLCLGLLLQLPRQCFLVCIGGAKGTSLEHWASDFASVMLKHVCQAFTVCRVSHTCKADTISFVIVTDEVFFFFNLLFYACVLSACVHIAHVCLVLLEAGEGVCGSPGTRVFSTVGVLGTKHRSSVSTASACNH